MVRSYLRLSTSCGQGSSAVPTARSNTSNVTQTASVSLLSSLNPK